MIINLPMEYCIVLHVSILFMPYMNARNSLVCAVWMLSKLNEMFNPNRYINESRS